MMGSIRDAAFPTTLHRIDLSRTDAVCILHSHHHGLSNRFPPGLNPSASAVAARGRGRGRGPAGAFCQGGSRPIVWPLLDSP